MSLSAIRDRVEQVLVDTSNAIWDTDFVDEGIRQALEEYSQAVPRRTITTATFASDTRELDISGISGLLSVERVWTPYTAADPEFPPNERAFEHWRASQILFFPRGDEPQSADVARIFYTLKHTLNGLDSEVADTYYLEDERLLVTGAAAICATSRGVDLMEKVTLDRFTAQQVRAWGLGKLQEFRAGLVAAGKREALRSNPVSEGKALDRWDVSEGWS